MPSSINQSRPICRSTTCHSAYHRQRAATFPHLAGFIADGTTALEPRVKICQKKLSSLPATPQHVIASGHNMVGRHALAPLRSSFFLKLQQIVALLSLFLGSKPHNRCFALIHGSRILHCYFIELLTPSGRAASSDEVRLPTSITTSS